MGIARVTMNGPQPAKRNATPEQAARIIIEHVDGRLPPKIAKEVGVPLRAVNSIISTFKKKVPKVNEGEIAIANQVAAMWRFGKITPFNPSELVTRKGLEIFDKMRQDDQVKAALAFKKLSCLASGWEVAPPEVEKDDPEDEISKFVEHTLKNVKGTLSEVVYNVMSALDYGYSVSEIVWQINEAGEWKNMIGVRAIKTRQPHMLDFETDEFGNIKPDGIVQTVPGMSIKYLPVTKFLVFTHQKEFDNWYGRSDLEAAYRSYWIKENSYRWLSMLLERFGIPPIFALYNPNKMTQQQITALVNVVQKIQAATAGALPRPSAEDLELWSPELAGQTERVFIPAIEMFNKDIARALLMPDLLGATSDQGVGSLARAQVHFDVFMLMVDFLRTQIADNVINEQLVKPLVDLNYGPQDIYPQFKFLPFTDEVKAELLNTWQAMITGGILHNQPADEDHIRALMKFPELDREALPEEPVPGEVTPVADPNKPNPNDPNAPDGEDPNAPPKNPQLGPDGQPLSKEDMDAKKIPATANFNVEVHNHYDPSQPRDPAGTDTGGRWTSGDGGAAAAEGKPAFEGDDPALAAALPDPADRKRLIEQTKEALQKPKTHLIDTPERWELRDQIAQNLYNEKTDAVDVKQDGEAWIVLGLPGAGKNTSVADPLAAKHGAVMIDSDDVKKLIPEYADGVGANAVHEEASDIILPAVLAQAVHNNDNIVMPRVGKSVDSLRPEIEALKKAGYKVNIVHVAVQPEKAIKRAITRWHRSGRLVSVGYMKSVDGNPKRTYETLKASQLVDSYQEWDNNGDNVPAVRVE